MSDGAVPLSYLASFLDSASKLEFNVNLFPRKPNLHPNGTITPEQEQWLRSGLTDYAEFIIPIFWSQTGFVGRPVSDKANSTEFASQGFSLVYSEYSAWHYAIKVASGTAYQSPGRRRQGYLAICRESLAIIALDSSWTPEPVYTGDGELSLFFMDKQIPPPNDCSASVALQLGYEEFESIATSELVRYEGFAMLLHSFTDASYSHSGPFRKVGNAARRYENDPSFSKLPQPIQTIELISRLLEEIPEIRELTDELVAKIEAAQPEQIAEKVVESIAGKKLGKLAGKLAGKANSARGYMFDPKWIPPAQKQWLAEQTPITNSWFESWYFEIAQELEQSMNVANGTGVKEPNFTPLKVLFNSALGIRIESARDGLEYFIESPFSEIDAALEAIKYKISLSDKAKETRIEKPPPTTDSGKSLADEISQLHSLHQAGALSDEEFSAAKSAILNKR